MNLTRLATLWLALAALTFAQTPTPPNPAPAPPPVTTEQTIYVPFDKLEQVFENQERGVFLPYREFLEMWNKLNLPEKLKEKEPPVEGVLASAFYGGKVTGDVAEIKARLGFEALKDGWSRLALGAGELSIAESKSTALLNFADGGYEMLFPKKGTYELEATLYGRVARETGRSTLRLKLPRTAVSQFDLVIPDKGLDFTITPASAFSSVENADGTRLIAYFGSSQEVSISWTKKTGDTALAPLLFADVNAAVRLSAGAVRTEVDVNYRILRAGVSAFDITVPENQQVLAVDGQNVKEWTVKAEQGTQRLRVALHTPAKDSYALKLRMESPLPPLPHKVALPLIQAQGVERQTGTVGVVSDPELVVEVADMQGLTQQSVATAKGAAPAGNTLSYRYLRLPYAGTISVAEAQPQVEVASELLLTLGIETLTLQAKLDYEVKKAGIFGIQIVLPDGYTPTETTGPNVDSATVKPAGNTRVLDVKFKQRVLGKFTYAFTAESPREKPDAAITVPVLDPLGVERHEAKIGLAIHVSLKANTVDKGDLREEDIRNLGGIAIKDAAATPLTLGFRYRGTAKGAQVLFELRKPRVSAEVLALVEVREALIRSAWTVAYNVEYAGVNEFSIEVPKVIADDVQIDGANIKERIKSEAKDAEGKPTDAIVWRIVLQDKVLGAYELRLTHDTARGEQKAGAVAQVALHELKPLGLFRETGQVAVIKDGNLEFTKTDPKGLEVIDPKELHGSLQLDGVFLAYKYSAHPVALKLDVSKNFYLDVPSAVVAYAVLTSVIAEDQAETTEVVYWVRNNSQQFFSIQLPSRGTAAAKLLSDAFVNGEPQQPSKRPDKNELLIRLPARQDGNELFPVRFVYEVPSPHPGQKLDMRGKLDIQPPKLGDTEVLQTRWTLYLPGDYRYVSFDGAMREDVGERGWKRFFGPLDIFLPHIGPTDMALEEPIASEPPDLPAPKTAGFDTQLQKEGVAVVLRRLDAPAPVVVGYRGKTYAATFEAIAFLLSLCGGLWRLGATRREKFAYFAVAGLGALVIAGAVNPRAAGVWQAVYLGAFISAVVWFTAGIGKALAVWVRDRAARRRATKTPPPMPPVQPMPPETGEAAK